MALVAIIVPMYNVEKYITSLLDCIKNQTFKDFKCFLIDDGSTDNTAEVIKPYLEDSRLEYHYQENKGPGAARNLGLSLLTDEKYVKMIDADDSIDSHLLEFCVELMEKNDFIDMERVQYIATNCKGEICSAGNLISFIELIPVERLDIHYVGWGEFLKTSIIKDNNLRYPENLKNHEDGVFGLDYLDHANWVCLLPTVLYEWKGQNENSLSAAWHKRSSDLGQEGAGKIIEIYQEWIKKHPNSKMIPVVKNTIKALSKSYEDRTTRWTPPHLTFD